MVRAIGRVMQHPKNRGKLTCSGAAARRLDEEVESHLAEETADNIARGMDPETARRAALRTFGNVEAAKETARERRPALLARHAVAGRPFRLPADRAQSGGSA